MNAPQEPTYKRLDEITADLLRKTNLTGMGPQLLANERVSAARGFAIAYLLFEARGRQALVDKIAAVTRRSSAMSGSLS